MRAKIFCALIAVTCLNSTDTLIDDNVTSREDNTIEIKDTENDSSRGSIVSRSKHWGSITLREINCGTIIGGIGSIVNHNGNCLGFIPSLLGVEFSYTYWFNNYVGIVGKAILCGDAYFSFIDDDNPAVAMLQFGGGVRWSYNGRGGRSNGTHYGGNVMINLMGGSFTDMSRDFKIDFNFGQVGVNISVVPFEWVNIKGFFGEVGTVFDIGALSVSNWGKTLLEKSFSPNPFSETFY